MGKTSTYKEQVDDISSKIIAATTRIKSIREGFIVKGKSLDNNLATEHQIATENVRYQENRSRIANLLLWTSPTPTAELRASTLTESKILQDQKYVLQNLDDQLAAIGEQSSPNERQQIIAMGQTIENLELELAKVSELRMKDAGY